MSSIFDIIDQMTCSLATSLTSWKRKLPSLFDAPTPSQVTLRSSSLAPRLPHRLLWPPHKSHHEEYEDEDERGDRGQKKLNETLFFKKKKKKSLVRVELVRVTRTLTLHRTRPLRPNFFASRNKIRPTTYYKFGPLFGQVQLVLRVEPNFVHP